MVKNLSASAGDIRDMGSTHGSGRSAGEGNGNPFKYSCLENPVDKGTWRVTVHGVARVGHHLSTKQQHFKDLISKYSHLLRGLEQSRYYCLTKFLRVRNLVAI